MLYHCGRKEMEAAHINIHGDISGFVLHLVKVHVWLMLCYWQLANDARQVNGQVCHCCVLQIGIVYLTQA